MKRVPCSGPGACKSRWSDAAKDYVPVKRDVEVPDGHVGEAFCSLECAAYAGRLKAADLPDEWVVDNERVVKWDAEQTAYLRAKLDAAKGVGDGEVHGG